MWRSWLLAPTVAMGTLVYGWGSNAAGQLGAAIELPAAASKERAANGDDDEEKLANRSAAAERRAMTQQLLTPMSVSLHSGRSIVQLSAGESHTLALDRLGFVWAFGRNREVRTEL